MMVWQEMQYSTLLPHDRADPASALGSDLVRSGTTSEPTPIAPKTRSWPWLLSKFGHVGTVQQSRWVPCRGTMLQETYAFTTVVGLEVSLRQHHVFYREPLNGELILIIMLSDKICVLPLYLRLPSSTILCIPLFSSRRLYRVEDQHAGPTIGQQPW